MFKKIIAASILAIASVGAFAHVWISPNNAGGKIMVVDPDNTCPIRYDNNGNAFAPESVTALDANGYLIISGCVVAFNGEYGILRVNWNDGSQTTLHTSSFVQIN
jgi:hypothetical protein